MPYVSGRERKRTRRRANGCAPRLCAAERELARKPLTPDAGRQDASTRARRLDELRGQLRFAGLTKQVGMTLAVIPQMRLRGGHGSLLSTCRTQGRARLFHRPPRESVAGGPLPVGLAETTS